MRVCPSPMAPGGLIVGGGIRPVGRGSDRSGVESPIARGPLRLMVPRCPPAWRAPLAADLSQSLGVPEAEVLRRLEQEGGVLAPRLEGEVLARIEAILATHQVECPLVDIPDPMEAGQPFIHLGLAALVFALGVASWKVWPDQRRFEPLLPRRAVPAKAAIEIWAPEALDRAVQAYVHGAFPPIVMIDRHGWLEVPLPGAGVCEVFTHEGPPYAVCARGPVPCEDAIHWAQAVTNAATGDPNLRVAAARQAGHYDIIRWSSRDRFSNPKVGEQCIAGAHFSMPVAQP